MSGQFRVAACQYPIERVPSFEHWQAKIRAWVAEAAVAGANLLLFPEYGSCETLDLVEGATLQELCEAHAAWLPKLREHYAALAREFDVLIVAGSCFERAQTGYVNRTRLFDSNGSEAFADKLMLTPEERRYGLVPGRSCSVFDTRLGRLGVAICYDSEFPLIAHALVEHGAALVLVPSCTDTLAGYHRVRIGCQARALENQCHVVQAVTVGAAPWSALLDENRGAAGIYAPPDFGLPSDGIIAVGALDAPQWVYADIDLGMMSQLRQQAQVSGRQDWARPEHVAVSVAVQALT